MTEDENDAFNLILAGHFPASVWNSLPVTADPEIHLIDWQIKEDTTGKRYFVGTRAEHGYGQVSTAIVEFDIEQLRGRTQSGRVYELSGPPGRSSDGEFVWSLYKIANRINEADK